MSLPVYSSREVAISWLGAIFEGFSPDSFVTLTANSDVTDEEVGADGQVVISFLPDQTGMITVELQQGSPTNIFLSGMLQAQRTTRILNIGNLTISDPSGAVLCSASKAHIKTHPEISLGSSASGKTYSWTFYCQDLAYLSVPAGSSATSTAVQTAGALITMAGILNGL